MYLIFIPKIQTQQISHDLFRKMILSNHKNPLFAYIFTHTHTHTHTHTRKVLRLFAKITRYFTKVFSTKMSSMECHTYKMWFDSRFMYDEQFLETNNILKNIFRCNLIFIHYWTVLNYYSEWNWLFRIRIFFFYKTMTLHQTEET